MKKGLGMLLLMTAMLCCQVLPCAAQDTGSMQEDTGATQEDAGDEEDTGAAREDAGDEEDTGTIQKDAGDMQKEAGGVQEHTGAAQEDAGDVQEETDRLQKEAEDLLSDLQLSGLDAYVEQEDLGQQTFTELVKDLMEHGFSAGSVSFSGIGESIKGIILQDYRENRKVLVQVLVLAIAFSVLLQMTSAMQKNYIAELGFLGVYLVLMLLLLKLFMLLTDIVGGFFNKLVDFMQVLQPVFCMSMVFSNGNMSAGAYYELLLLLIYLVDVVFARILLPVVQVYLGLQLVDHMMEEERFQRVAGLLSDIVCGCIKVFTTAVIGLNLVQGLLAPGIDGLKRSTFAGAVRIVPGAGQIMNSMTEILAGSAMLIKNSVGVAALLILVAASFLPLIKVTVFMLLYKGCAALAEPVADKRITAAVAALGQSAGLYLKLMFYAVLLFFLTIAIICAATTVSISI